MYVTTLTGFSRYSLYLCPCSRIMPKHRLTEGKRFEAFRSDAEEVRKKKSRCRSMACNTTCASVRPDVGSGSQTPHRFYFPLALLYGTTLVTLQPFPIRLCLTGKL